MDILDHLFVENDRGKKEESIKIKGGAISITLVNAFISLGKLTFDIGKSLGTALRRGFKNVCKI